jgi:hypothetical protein
LSAGSCALGRDSSDYLSFVASHHAIRPGMAIRQVFEAGLADYLIKLGGKNVPGSTLPEKEPVSADCRRHVFDVSYGSGDLRTPGGFYVRVYCNMNGPSDRQVTPQGSFQTKGAFLQGLETYSSWAKSMSFRVESPPSRHTHHRRRLRQLQLCDRREREDRDGVVDQQVLELSLSWPGPTGSPRIPPHAPSTSRVAH